jgi:hypothetical protein
MALGFITFFFTAALAVAFAAGAIAVLVPALADDVEAEATGCRETAALTDGRVAAAAAAAASVLATAFMCNGEGPIFVFLP